MVSLEGTTTYGYSGGDPASVTNPHGETTSWTYDAYNRLTRQTLSTGSTTDYGFDSQGRQTSIIHKKASGSVISQETYQFDPVGNMATKTVDGVATYYQYDNADQLTYESRPGYTALYQYDGNGNRLAKTLNGVVESYTYDDGDKMLTAGAKSYTYDLAGRTKTVTSPAGLTTLNYDDEDRLTQVTGVAGNQTYTYNGLDARRTKTSGGVTNTYKRHGVSPTAPVISDGQATYTPGISERRSGVSKWSHQDYLGSTKQISDSSETTTDTFQFDAFGLQTGRTGTTPTPFGFAGGWGYQSDGTGLQLLGHRYYDPSTGRFLTRDPIKDGRNWYGYCDNNPIKFVDANGLEKIIILKGNQTDPNDIEGYTDNIIADYKREHPKDQIEVYENADEALAALEDADALIIVGHYDPNMEGPWDPIQSGIDAKDGSRLDPHDISRRRRGKPLKWIHLVMCNSLTNEANAAAWARLCNGNLWGFYGLVAINLYAHGMVGLHPYKKGNSKKSKTWYVGRKKYGYPRGATR